MVARRRHVGSEIVPRGWCCSLHCSPPSQLRRLLRPPRLEPSGFFGLDTDLPVWYGLGMSSEYTITNDGNGMATIFYDGIEVGTIALSRDHRYPESIGMDKNILSRRLEFVANGATHRLADGDGWSTVVGSTIASSLPYLSDAMNARVLSDAEAILWIQAQKDR